MALKPEASIMTGLAVMAVVVAVHTQATPTQADTQALPSGNKDIDAAERKATVIGAGVVAGISLLAKDPTVFIIGSVTVIGMAIWTRHSNFLDSASGVIGGVSRAGSPNTMPEAEVSESVPYTMYNNNDFISN